LKEKYRAEEKAKTLEAESKEPTVEVVKEMVAKGEGKPVELKPETKAEKPPEPQRRKQVCIVGFAPSSFHLAPFGDLDIEIWGLNNLWTSIPWQDLAKQGRLRWFDIHPPEEYAMPVHGNQLKWLREAKGFPIYTIEKMDGIPGSVRFPIEKCLQAFGSYFNNSVSYMIALAILEGFETIHIYGVDMAQVEGGEYAEQRPSCEYMIGFAKGAGRKVYVTPYCDLLKTAGLYGYDDETLLAFKKKLFGRSAEYKQRVAMESQKEQQARDSKNQCMGVVSNMEYIQRNFMWKPPNIRTPQEVVNNG